MILFMKHTVALFNPHEFHMDFIEVDYLFHCHDINAELKSTIVPRARHISLGKRHSRRSRVHCPILARTQICIY